MNLLCSVCSVGLACWDNFIDYTKEVGSLLSWPEVLGIGGIIFAATQFMEAVKIRNYRYRTFASVIPAKAGI